MKNIIFIAPPAAGKGTQAKLLSAKYNIPHISTGDLLREEIAKQTKIGLSIKKDLEQGNLVSDEVITTLLKNRITKSDCINGYILDGYPRNLVQAKKYNELLEELNFDKGIVIYFNIDEQVALKRTLSRIICSNCGTSYNLLIDGLRPQNDNICDKCNHTLQIRKDDTEEIFKHRFETYINSTKDLIEYYKEKGLLYEIEVSEKAVDTIFKEVKEILND